MVDFNASIDYMKLMKQAAAEGNFAQAARYEQQRNAKIDATGSSYEKTYDYQQYLNGTNTPSGNSYNTGATSSVDKNGYATGSNTTGSLSSGNSAGVKVSSTPKTYDNNTNYRTLIDEAAKAGNYARAAQLELERNQKIDDTDSSYGKTYDYQQYLNNGNTGTASNTGAQFNASIDYQKLINQSVANGDFASAAEYERQRNAKIDATGSPYAKTYTYQSFSSQPVSIPEYQAPDYADEIAALQQTIQELKNTKYTPVDEQQYMGDVLTYDQAYELAKSIIAPQYKTTFEQNAVNSAQNLEKAGLYDSLYGQALAAQSQNQLSDAMNSAIGSLSTELQGMSYNQAYQLLQSAISENQFGTSVRQNALSNAASMTANIIGLLQNEASARNDYAMQAASLQLEQQRQALENQYLAKQITGQQLDNQMKELETKAQQVASSYGVRTGGGSGSSVGNDEYNEIVSKQQAMREAGYPVTVDGIWGSDSQRYWDEYKNGSSSGDMKNGAGVRAGLTPVGNIDYLQSIGKGVEATERTNASIAAILKGYNKNEITKDQAREYLKALRVNGADINKILE